MKNRSRVVNIWSIVVLVLVFGGVFAWATLLRIPVIQMHSMSNLTSTLVPKTYSGYTLQNGKVYYYTVTSGRTPETAVDRYEVIGADPLTFMALNSNEGKDKNHLYVTTTQAVLSGPGASTLDLSTLSWLSVGAGGLFKDQHAVYTISYDNQSGLDNTYVVTAIPGADPTKCTADNFRACEGDGGKQLATDLSKVTPQLVDDREEYSLPPIPLSPDLERIKIDLLSFNNYSANQYVVLYAVGKRYVAATGPDGAGDGPPSIYVFDSVTLTSKYLARLFQLRTEKIAVFVSATDICTYAPDQSSCVAVPGAKLSGNEIYGDDQNSAAYLIPQDATLTDTSLKIAVLTWVNPYTIQAKLQKVREATFTLP
jgi:hypothetical protein